MTETIEFVVPVNTPILTPLLLKMDYPFEAETSIKVFVPDGHQGLTGLQINASGRRLVPDRGSTGWLRGDGKEFGPYKFSIQGPPWSLELIGYNTDISYPHTFFIYMD